MTGAAIFLAATTALHVPAIADADVLEESVAMEVRHAIARAASSPGTNRVDAASSPSTATRVAAENATEEAIRIVSVQRPDGRWYDGTNDVTAVMVKRLERLLGE